MNTGIVHKMARAALSGSLPFPEIVRNLLAEDVESYQVDYIALQMKFYGGEDSIVVVPLNFEGLPVVARDFDTSVGKVISMSNGFLAQSHQVPDPTFEQGADSIGNFFPLSNGILSPASTLHSVALVVFARWLTGLYGEQHESN